MWNCEEERSSLRDYLVDNEYFHEGDEVGDCCATYILKSFPPDDFLQNNEEYLEKGVTKRDLYDEILNEIRSATVRAYNYNKSLIVATVNTNQKLAAKALKASGFSSSKWAKRKNYTGDRYQTRVKIFFKEVCKRDENSPNI